MQLPVARRRPLRSLTAAATRVRKDDAQYNLRLKMPWQYRAMFYTDAIGELHYASNFYARMLQRLRIFPAYLREDGTLEEIKEGPPVTLLNRIQDPGGGRTALLGMYGRLMFITGEGYLFGRGIGLGREKWKFVWREELRFDEEGIVTHVLAPQIPYESFDLSNDDNFEVLPAGSAEAYRMWTPHPRFSAWPDSPMHAILDEAEELLVLSRSVMATATSRLVRAPLLAIPEEISPAPPATIGDEDPLNDPFLRDFTDHLERAIEDPSMASSLAPYVLYAQSEWIDKIKPIFLHQTDSDYMERDLRKECLERIFLGLDMPPEVGKGMSDANHWAAWWISDDMWRSHGAPIAEQFCDDLNDAYLQEALIAANFERANEVVVGFDPSAVVVNPDRSKDANEAWDRGAIGYAAYLNAKNFKPSDAQTEDEHIEWLALKKVVIGPDGYPVPDTGSGGTAPTENGTNPGDDPGTPDGEPGPVSEGTNLPASAARFRGAAEMALMRCRELAGSRLRSRRKSCPHCLEGVEDVPNALVAAALGRVGCEPLGSPDPRVLVAGGCESFKTLLVGWGYDDKTALTVSDFLELHAARTLFHREASVPETFAVVE